MKSLIDKICFKECTVLESLKRKNIFHRKDSTFIKIKCNYHSASTLDNKETQTSRLIFQEQIL